MQSKESKLLEEFETEMWLYIDESLPDDRIKYWDVKIEEFPKLKEMLDESQNVLSLYDESAEYELNESKFNDMIKRAAVESNKPLNNIKEFFYNRIFPFLSSYRLAFGAAIIVLFALLTFIIEKPNNNNVLPPSSLDWKGKSLSSKMESVDNSIRTIKTEETMEYQMYRFTRDKFDRAVQSIGDRINKLKNNMDSKSL